MQAQPFGTVGSGQFIGKSAARDGARSIAMIIGTSLALAALALAPGCKKTQPAPVTPATTAPAKPSIASAEVRQPSIVVIGPHLAIANDGYWQSVRQGAELAAKELGVKLEWRSPTADVSLAALPAYVTTNLNGCDAAIITPENQETLSATVEAAHKKMPVVCIGMKLSTAQATATVRSDQARAGEMAGDEMVKALGPNGGKVAIIGIVRGPTGGSANATGAAAAASAPASQPSAAPIPAATAERVERYISFEKAIATHPHIEIVVQPDSPLVVSAATPLEGVRSELQAHPGLAGIFCLDAIDGNVVLQAVNEGVVSGQIKTQPKIVACGSSPQLRTAVADKQVSALIVESGQDVGYQAVKTVVAALRNRPFAAETLLQPTAVTLADIKSPGTSSGNTTAAPATPAPATPVPAAGQH